MLLLFRRAASALLLASTCGCVVPGTGDGIQCNGVACSASQRCVAGACRAACAMDGTCPDGLHCEGGSCLPTVTQPASSRSVVPGTSQSVLPVGSSSAAGGSTSSFPPATSSCAQMCGAACVPAGSCCDAAGCGPHQVCPSPGGACHCADGYKTCGGQCTPVITCCTSPDDCTDGRTCSPDGVCLCPGTVLDPAGEVTATCSGGVGTPRVTLRWPSRGLNSVQKQPCPSGWAFMNNPTFPPWVDDGTLPAGNACGLVAGQSYTWRVKYDANTPSNTVTMVITPCNCGP